MDDPIQFFFLVKNLVELQDIIQFIMKIYIFILPREARPGDLLFKCSCQRMSRIIDYPKSNPLLYESLFSNKVIYVPKEEIAFKSSQSMLVHPMVQISKKEVNVLDNKYKTDCCKCEYCNAKWLRSRYVYYDNIRLKSAVMILCVCGEFGKRYPCGNKRCIPNKCEFNHCQNKTTESPTICNEHYMCETCQVPYRWSIWNENIQDHLDVFWSTCDNCGSNERYYFSEYMYILPIIFPDRFIKLGNSVFKSI